MDSGHIETNGQRLYYETSGEGYPLLLIMGLGGDLTGWWAQTPAFEKHFQVIAFDNRDVGRSSLAKGPYTIKDMADDTIGLLDGLGVDKAHVLGVSMGGAIAQELALNYPERVNKLILGCTMAQIARYRVSFVDSWKWVVQHDKTGEGVPATIIAWCMTHSFQQNAEAVDEMIEQMLNPPYPQTPEAYGRQCDALSGFDALDRLGNIQTSTLVLVADQDLLTPPWLSRQLAEAIPGAQLKIIEGGSHCSFWEIPDTFNQAVLDFLLA